MEPGNFNRDQPELQSDNSLIFANDKYYQSNIIQSSFVLTAGNRIEESVLRVSKVRQLFSLNTRTDISGTEYMFLQYMKIITVLNEVYVKLGCVCMS